MIQPGKKKKSFAECLKKDSLKSEKKKSRASGNHSNLGEETACPLNQLKRKFCSLFVTENCISNKKAKTDEIVDVEINSPEIEKDEASKLGIIEMDEFAESPLESFNNQLTDSLLTKKLTVRENCLPKQKYFEPTPGRWLQCPEEAARAIVPYMDAQQIILNTSTNGEWRDDMVPDNVPSNDLLYDSYNYTQGPYQRYNQFYNNGEFYDIDENGPNERGDVEEIEDDDEEGDMDMEII